MVERHIYGYKRKETGVYVYVGSAFDVAERDREHRKLLQIPFDRFMMEEGPDNFELVVLETVHGETKVDCGLKAVPREDHWMNEKKTWHKFGTSGKNFLRARVMWLDENIYEAQCAAISEGQKRAWTPERKQWFSESQIGNIHSQGHKHPEGWKAEATARQAGQRNSFAGKSHSPEAREEMSLRRKGEGNAFFRKTHTQETKDKIGKANSLPFMEENKEEVIRRYEEGQSMAMVAEWAGTGAPTVLRYFRMWGIKTRSLSEAQLIKHGRKPRRSRRP
jgi:group I intron endonuclease